MEVLRMLEEVCTWAGRLLLFFLLWWKLQRLLVAAQHVMIISLELEVFAGEWPCFGVVIVDVECLVELFLHCFQLVRLSSHLAVPRRCLGRDNQESVDFWRVIRQKEDLLLLDDRRAASWMAGLFRMQSRSRRTWFLSSESRFLLGFLNDWHGFESEHCVNLLLLLFELLERV